MESSDHDKLMDLIAEFEAFRSGTGLATLHDLKHAEKNIMSAISQFADAMNTFNDAQDKAIADIATEIAALNTQIATLQASPGQISPADQTALDALKQRASGIAKKVEALDTINPPPAPVV